MAESQENVGLLGSESADNNAAQAQSDANAISNADNDANAISNADDDAPADGADGAEAPVSTTELPGERSGTDLKKESDGSQSKKQRVYMIIREPYSSYRRNNNQPAGDHDRELDLCLLFACCIFIVVAMALIIWACVVASSPKKSQVYTVDSTSEPAPTKPDPLAELRNWLAAQENNLKQLELKLHEANATVENSVNSQLQEVRKDIRDVAEAEVKLIQTALANDYCDLTLLVNMQPSDDAKEYSQNPEFAGCELEIVLMEGTEQTKAFVYKGKQCDIVCNEKAGFWNLADIGSFYDDYPKKIVCHAPIPFDANSTVDSNDNSPSPSAFWAMAGRDDRLIDTSLPQCYRRHCPLSLFDALADFKCPTVPGPFDTKTVLVGDDCEFVGCKVDAVLVEGIVGSVFHCTPSGAFLPTTLGDPNPICASSNESSTPAPTTSMDDETAAAKNAADSKEGVDDTNGTDEQTDAMTKTTNDQTKNEEANETVNGTATNTTNEMTKNGTTNDKANVTNDKANATNDKANATNENANLTIESLPTNSSSKAAASGLTTKSKKPPGKVLQVVDVQKNRTFLVEEVGDSESEQKSQQVNKTSNGSKKSASGLSKLLKNQLAHEKDRLSKVDKDIDKVIEDEESKGETNGSESGGAVGNSTTEESSQSGSTVLSSQAPKQKKDAEVEKVVESDLNDVDDVNKIETAEDVLDNLDAQVPRKDVLKKLVKVAEEADGAFSAVEEAALQAAGES